MLGDNTTHANFSVDDLEAAKRFYVDKLGFKVALERKYDMMLESGAGTRANIYYKEDHKPWDSTVFGIEVADVEAAVTQLAQAGIQVEKFDMTDDDGIARDPDMGDAAWFKDPAGNWICVANFGSI
jgi:catechol 2,3-dioxygenase-like lactoylglutathione lyase family enzyme